MAKTPWTTWNMMMITGLDLYKKNTAEMPIYQEKLAMMSRNNSARTASSGLRWIKEVERGPNLPEDL